MNIPLFAHCGLLSADTERFLQSKAKPGLPDFAPNFKRIKQVCLFFAFSSEINIYSETVILFIVATECIIVQT